VLAKTVSELSGARVTLTADDGAGIAP
jgi:hypothetical protein